MADPLYSYCKDSISVWGGWVYFAAGGEGVLRVPCAGGEAEQVDALAGYLAAKNGHLYFERGTKGLWRKDLATGELAQLDTAAGYLVVTDEKDDKDSWVYYKRGDDGPLCRVPCLGSPDQVEELYKAGGYLAVDDVSVYFQAGDDGLYRMARDGSGEAVQIDPHAGFVAVRNDVIYFHADGYGTYRMPITGSLGDATKMDDNGGYMAVTGDGWVYFQGGSQGIHRMLLDATPGHATQLDPNGEYLTIPGDGWIYFQGGDRDNQLYRMVQPATCSLPAGLTMKVQDEYVVNTIFDTDDKFDVVKVLLDEASLDTSDRWFINFTSGASSGAYPDAVAHDVNEYLALYVGTDESGQRNRLGTIVMDFPNREPDLIPALIEYNPLTSPVEPTSWMGALPDDTRISHLTIPGTHDTCTFDASPISKCQDLDLPAQLSAGIRFIDIRCRHFNDKFELHHGSDYQDGTFDYVLQSCRDFFALPDAERETIIVSVKEEYEPESNTTNFEQRFMKYVEDYEEEVTWYLKLNPELRLRDVRGQLVLLRRFYIQDSTQCAYRGFDLSAWPENTTFSKP